MRDLASYERKRANETEAEFLARRVRIVLWMIVLSNVAFAASDPWLNPDHVAPLLLLKVVVLAVHLAAIVALQRPSRRRRTVVIALACFAVAASVSAFSGFITGDPFTTPLLCVAGALITASVIPWGVRAQMLAASVAVLGVVANAYLLLGLPEIGYPLVGIVALAVISVYISYELGWQRRAEAEAKRALQQHQAELAHVLRVGALGEMAAQLAHELTQPLGAIANYAAGCKHRLQAGLEREDEIAEAVDRIAAEALRAGEIIRSIRGFVRKTTPRRTRVELNQLAREVAQLVEPEARQHGVSVRLALQPNLPSIEADAVQIEQVVINLVRNALEAMYESPGAEASLAVTTQVVDIDRVELAVRDSGPGLRNGDAAKVFEAFHTTKANGLGMGLAISRSIIEAHGGRLWMTSNSGRGLTFHFTLPS